MANWVARAFSSIYDPIKRRGGAAYFELITGTFIKNERYAKVPDLRYLTPSDIRIRGISLRTDVAMYELLREPEKLAFLVKPAGFFDNHVF
jgi:glucose-6-phosphate isomerase